MNNRMLLSLAVSIFCCALWITAPRANDQLPTAAPMSTELAGQSATLAMPSVFRVVCPSKNIMGSCFLHKSGAVITAAHVVEGCTTTDLLLINSSGQTMRITNVISDIKLDLALLYPQNRLIGPSLALSTNDRFSVGAQVSTWGYPAGYMGMLPLLCSGYLSGIGPIKLPDDTMVIRWVINAAFNSGNSGGPLVEIEHGQVIGVVSSKLAPLPPDIESALSALRSQDSGMMFSKRSPNGASEQISEAQVIEQVLQYLRSQTQLVIGYAVTIDDLRNFLVANNIEP